VVTAGVSLIDLIIVTTMAGLIGTIVPTGMCGLFLVSAAKKLAMPRSVTRMVEDVGVPGRFVGVLAPALVVAELMAGVAAVWPATRVIAGTFTAVLGSSFGAAAGVALRAHRVVLCACFGTSRTPLGMPQILRMPLFWAAAAVQIIVPPAWSGRFSSSVTAGVVAVMCLVQAVLTARVVRAGAADRNALSESTDSSVAV